MKERNLGNFNELPQGFDPQDWGSLAVGTELLEKCQVSLQAYKILSRWVWILTVRTSVCTKCQSSMNQNLQWWCILGALLQEPCPKQLFQHLDKLALFIFLHMHIIHLVRHVIYIPNNSVCSRVGFILDMPSIILFRLIKLTVLSKLFSSSG